MPPAVLRAGSLFSGYMGLDQAVHSALARCGIPVETAWVCDNDPAAAALLTHHHPDLPNLGDITTVDWVTAEPVDVLAAGFPCQDVSSAGRRFGLRPDTRSGLWTHTAHAIDQMRPRLVVIENVRGLLSADADCDVEPCPWCLGDDEGRPLRALGCVLGDLANLGYDTRWCGLRAADVGAPHGRYRIFIIAWPAADANGVGPVRDRGARDWRTGPAHHDLPAADHGPGFGERARPEPRDGDTAAADPDGARRRARSGLPGPGGTALVGDGAPAAANAAGPRRGPRPRVDVEVDGGASLRAGETEPGRRDRAAAPDPDSRSSGRWAEQPGRGPRNGAAAGRGVAADSQGDGWGEGRPEPARIVGGSDAAVSGDRPAPDPDRVRRQGWSERHVGPETGQPTPQRADPAGRVLDWGAYAPAIRRWELILGRPAPAPTQVGQRGGQQLSPHFVEWMMGLPEGHVTAVPGLTRNQQLRLLGNGVVPQQAAHAIGLLLDRVPEILDRLQLGERVA